MDFEIITIFPDLIEAMAPYGVVGRAGECVRPPADALPAEAARWAAHAPSQSWPRHARPQRPQVQADPQGRPQARTLSGMGASHSATAPLPAAQAAAPLPGADGAAGPAGGGRVPRYRLRCWNPRDFTFDNYRRVDDRPYGGGPGMVMLAEPLLRCVQAIRQTREKEGRPPLPLIHLSPQGRPFAQPRARTLAASSGAMLLCGRYEAIDQRFLDAEVDEEISMGDFVVSGGELPAMLLLDAVVRLLPGVLNHGESATQDSFEDGLLDCPHYTRPEHLPGLPARVAPDVPAVLLSGNHREIEAWRQARAREATAAKRPELLAAVPAPAVRPEPGRRRVSKEGGGSG